MVLSARFLRGLAGSVAAARRLGVRSEPAVLGIPLQQALAFQEQTHAARDRLRDRSCPCGRTTKPATPRATRLRFNALESAFEWRDDCYPGYTAGNGRFRPKADGRIRASKHEAEKSYVLDRRHLVLVLVDRQFQLPVEPSGQPARSRAVGERPCSKLDEDTLQGILSDTGDQLQDRGRDRRWKQRRVVFVDGTGVRGNMRDIRRQAARLAALDERYRPLAERLDRLAQGYQSQAILRLMEQVLEGK